MRETRSFLLLLLVVAAPGLAASEPTPAQAEAALRAFVKAHPGAKQTPTVNAVVACFPAHADEPAPAGAAAAPAQLCLLRLAGYEESQPMAFREQGGAFALVADASGEPAELDVQCPSPAEAERFLRRVRPDAGATVTGYASDGVGVFTDQRGQLREKLGPERLMCTYATHGALGAYTAVLYTWRKAGA
jgi:hypothetical protein